jgi:RHS repeat-associated protein
MKNNGLGGDRTVLEGEEVLLAQDYAPYGEVLASSGTGASAYGFAGEWTDASGLQYLRARMYSPETGQFFQPDTYISDPFISQSWNRYAYSRNNPINFIDPTGHFPEPPPLPIPDYSIIGQTMQYLLSQGYSVVGDPVSKSIYANGADIVFQKLDEVGKVLETLGVECKAVISNRVDLGTLGKNAKGTTYGGSIERVINSATRFLSSSKDQLRMESEAIIQGQKLNNLRNVLFTTAEGVSIKAKDIFNYVYVIAADGTVTAVKTFKAFSSNTIKLPGLLVPYYIIDPKNSPWYNPKIRN